MPKKIGHSVSNPSQTSISLNPPPQTLSVRDADIAADFFQLLKELKESLPIVSATKSVL